MKYIIELEQIEGTDLYKAKGCNTLVFDQNGIDKILKPFDEEEIRVDIAKECKYLLNCGMGKIKALNHLIKILGAEHIESCQFKKDELVEVSDDGINWKLRHFAKMANGRHYVYILGYKSSETTESITCKYCRKYGTLGGRTSEETTDTQPWGVCQKYGTLGGIAKEQNE